MHIERTRPTVFRVTLHAYELSTLVAAARWALEGAEGELPEDARNQLRTVLDAYDAEIRNAESSRTPGPLDRERDRKPSGGADAYTNLDEADG